MNYRSVADLNRAISSSLDKVPHDVDLVVGIPRSGLLTGNLIALAMNVHLADLDSFVENRKLRCGLTRTIE